MESRIRDTILRFFRQKKQLKDIGEDDRFFELGASSLTIIELQIAIEEALGVTIPTAQLMRFDTIKEWIAAYSLRAQDRDGISIPETSI